MEVRKNGEDFRVVVWIIKNFSCWNREMHANVITSPPFDCGSMIILMLYPRGVSGCGEDVVVRVSVDPPSSLSGELAFISGYGFLGPLCTLDVDSKEGKERFVQPPIATPLKFEDAASEDHLTLRFRMKVPRGEYSKVEYLSTEIEVCHMDLPIAGGLSLFSDKVLNKVKKFPFEVKVFASSESSKILLKLKPSGIAEKALVSTKLYVHQHDRASDRVLLEEKERVLPDRATWTFSKCITKEEALGGGFSLSLEVKIIPGTNVNQSSDVQIRCGGVVFLINRMIVCSRSPIFDEIIWSWTLPVDVEDMDPSTLSRFLAFVYSGGVEGLQFGSAIELYNAAHLFRTCDVKTVCICYFRNNLSVSNVCYFLSLADNLGDRKLRSVVLEFIVDNYHEVLSSSEWRILLKRNPLLVAETATEFAWKGIVGLLNVS